MSKGGTDVWLDGADLNSSYVALEMSVSKVIFRFCGSSFSNVNLWIFFVTHDSKLNTLGVWLVTKCENIVLDCEKLYSS